MSISVDVIGYIRVHYSRFIGACVVGVVGGTGAGVVEVEGGAAVKKLYSIQVQFSCDSP